MPISTRMTQVPGSGRDKVVVTMSVTWQELGGGQELNPDVRPLLFMSSNRRHDPFGKPQPLLDFVAELRKAGYGYNISWEHTTREDEVIFSIRVTTPKRRRSTQDALEVVRAALRVGFGENLNEVQ